MFRAVVLLSLASILLAALALISCLSVEDKREIRGLPRSAWVIVILLVPLGGAIAWFLLGRPRPAGQPAFTWPGMPGPREPQQQAPDDDPDFLRSLEEHRTSSEEEDLLRKWEEDLRRREDEQRHRDPGNEA